MKYEQIEQAARDLCTSDRQEQWLKDFGTACFADGARWRINSVWHDAKTETPVHNGYIAVLCPNGIMETMWYNTGIGFDETRLRAYDMWAYVSNLIPERKEETK